MKKALLIYILAMFFLVVASGCTPNQEQADPAPASIDNMLQEMKVQAQADVDNAMTIAMVMSRAFAENSISKFEKNQELNSESEYGKKILSSNSVIPEPMMGNNYKFYVSVKEDGEVFVSAGETAETAVQLYPRPKKFSAPNYDILNLPDSEGSSGSPNTKKVM